MLLEHHPEDVAKQSLRGILLIELREQMLENADAKFVAVLLKERII